MTPLINRISPKFKACNVMSLLVSVAIAGVATYLSMIANRMTYRMARNDLIYEVRSWGDEVVDLLSRAFALCDLNPSRDRDAFFARRHELIHKSSALLDRGRFFFPNFYKEDVGLDNPDAFQGIRPQILDLMKLAHALTRSINYTANDVEQTQYAEGHSLR